jgi:hypothetical protein
MQRNWITKSGSIAQGKNRYTQLKNRYGPWYTTAILGAVFITFILPIPGITLASVALIVLIAEVHGGFSRRGSQPEIITSPLVVVKINLPNAAVLQSN